MTSVGAPYSGLHQVRIAEQHRRKTAFASSQGLFEWNAMPFGLTSVPATYARLMDLVLAGLSWQCVNVYIDDLIIYSKSLGEHIQHLELVAQRLRAANLRAHPQKSCLFRRELVYLGHDCGVGGRTKTRTAFAPRNQRLSNFSISQQRSFFPRLMVMVMVIVMARVEVKGMAPKGRDNLMQPMRVDMELCFFRIQLFASFVVRTSPIFAEF